MEKTLKRAIPEKMRNPAEKQTRKYGELQGSPAGEKSWKKEIAKETLDYAGFSLTSPQFMNVFLFISGASIFLIGIVNAARVFLNTISAGLAERMNPSRITILFAGLLLSATLLAMIFAISSSNPLILAGTLLASGMIIAIMGTFRQSEPASKNEPKIAHRALYNSAIGSAILLITGLALDRVSSGYSLVLSAAALVFLISTILKMLMPSKSEMKKTLGSVKEGLGFLRESSKNPFLLILLINMVIITSAQIASNSFYGVFIYNNFFITGIGGFANIAIIFSIAIIASLIGPKISLINFKEIGNFPLLVFGTAISSITPLSYVFSPNLASIGAATFLGMIGGAISGVSLGLYIGSRLQGELRQKYYSIMAYATVPSAMIASLIAYIGQSMGLVFIFLTSGIMLIAASMVFFIMVLLYKERELL
ncbi:hypothetical protein HYY72_00345 [Candidatus Woesearchaeota archaeon]|nr:hypothetical protein [Candidatus Woesearchaeota archaeon]